MADNEPNDAAKPPPMVGSYRLVQPLGSGGMSSVFLALHRDTGHEVAVKVLPRALARNPTLLQRFIREAKNAESLEHPNIAAIYDRGFDNGRHYLVLEYVAGGDLHERVRASGPLPPAEAVRVIRSAAEGLDYASGRGVVHRDIKPANLLVTPEGRVKIIDLGLALQAESEDERVTRDGTTVGTVDYMAPEQARDSRATSERSDIYSLGCTLYYLLTGSPPYPGGSVPDKLGRHCTAPVPEVRDLRPEVSEPLAALVRRMMAKKPEARFPDYMSLIAALDALPESRGASGETLDALIADDEEEAPLDALVVDDDDDIELAPADDERRPTGRPAPTIAGLGGAKPPPRPAPNLSEPAPAEISIAMLAGIEDDAPAAKGRRPSLARAQEEAEDEGGAFELAQSRPTARRISGEVPLSTWVASGAVLGLAIALIGFGVVQFLAPTSAGPVTEVKTADEGQGGGQSEPPVFVPPSIVRTPERPIIAPKPAKVVAAPAAPTWTEPSDPSPIVPPEPTYSAVAEAASLPEWARRPIPAADGPVVAVRRVPNAADASDVPTLRAALNAGAGTIEIADDGPFFEDDFLDRARSRTIRARPGFRPMIVVEPSPIALVRDRSSVFTLDGSRLVIEGIDLVIDARALPQSLTSLFHLKGAELTISRCTITVLEASQHPFTLVRVEEPGDQRPNRSSQVRVEGSLLRGAAPVVFDVSGSGDIVVNRSVVLGGSEALLVHRPTAPRDPRRYFFYRSILASRASAMELPGGRSAPAPQVRALGSTFAKVAGLNAAGFVHVRGDLAGPPTGTLDWLGEDDAFVGWPAWMDAGERGPKAVLADLAAARALWKGTDPASREVRRAWPVDDLATPTTLAPQPEARASVLARVVDPGTSLIEATVGSLQRTALPEVASRPASITGFPTKPAAKGDLSFDPNDPAWRGDLGVYLARQVAPGVGHVTVRVTGSGTWPMTPVRLPDGASVSIESTVGQGPGPMWVAQAGVAAPALIEVQGGDLSLTGVTLAWSPSSRVERLIRIEDGHLLLARCALKSGELTMPAGSGLILFRAPGTKPLTPRPGPFLSPVDRPTCRLSDCLLMSVGGDALAAELGRGTVGLMNTAVLVEGDGAAIALRPQKVARARFEADLILDRCSIAAESSLVQFGPWPGTDPGPARPWLVSSRKSAFFEVAARGRRSSVLLRSLDFGLAHGALAWQADGDGYDLAYFTASGPGDPPPYRQRPDVKALWVDFWGARHIRNVVGPNPRKDRDGASILTRDRLRPGALTVDDLRLDAKAYPDLGVDLRQLPASWTRAVPIRF